MSPYNESVTAIDSPLLFGHEPYWETDDIYSDLQRVVQRRMFLILSIVSLIVLALTMFALPSRSTAASTKGQTSIVTTTVDSSNEANSLGILVKSSGSGSSSISPIFTDEVRYWESKIIEWADEHELDPNAVATIMQIESCGNPQAVSVAGARGLFQVMPFHFSGNEDMLDPDTNARRGLNFFNEQLRYTGGDELLSFAGYNGGYAASGGNYASWADETKRYYEWAKGIYGDAKSGSASSETLEAWLSAGGAAGCQRAASNLNIK